MRKKNPFGKSTTQDKPYAIYEDGHGWQWRVLKTYQHPDNEKGNEYARWLVSATSPLMHDGGYEMGDQYSNIVLESGFLTSAFYEWKQFYGD